MDRDQRAEGAGPTDRWWGSYAARASGMVASEVRALFAVASRPEIVSLAGGMPAVLEVNVAPGLTDTSTWPMALQAAGLDLAVICRDLAATAPLRRAPG